MFFFVTVVWIWAWIWAGYNRWWTTNPWWTQMSICDDLFHHYCLLLLLWPVHLWRMKKPIRDALFRSNKCMTRDTWRFGWSSLWVICDAFSLVYDESNLLCIREFLVVKIRMWKTVSPWVYEWHKTHKYIHCGGIKMK